MRLPDMGGGSSFHVVISTKHRQYLITKKQNSKYQQQQKGTGPSPGLKYKLFEYFCCSTNVISARS